MIKLHPLIKERFYKLGKAYEKLHNDSFYMEEERLKFSESLQPFISKFEAFITEMDELEKVRDIKYSLDARKKTLNEMAAKGMEFLNLYLKCNEASDIFDKKVIDFKEGSLEVTLIGLIDTEDNAPHCEVIMDELEKEYAHLEDEFPSIQQSLANVKSKFEEILKIYNSLLN